VTSSVSNKPLFGAFSSKFVLCPSQSSQKCSLFVKSGTKRKKLFFFQIVKSAKKNAEKILASFC
jgi:hypothetical protein